MKWIKIVLGGFAGLLVLVVVVLVLLGMRKDASRMQTSITLRQRPEVIFPYLYDAQKFKSWVSWVLEVQRPDGEPTVGSELVVVMEDKNNGGAQMRITSRIEAVEMNRHLRVALSVPKAFTGTADYTLKDQGNGETLLSLDSHYNLDHWFAKLMMPVVLVSARKKMNGDLERLKTVVEAVK